MELAIEGGAGGGTGVGGESMTAARWAPGRARAAPAPGGADDEPLAPRRRSPPCRGCVHQVLEGAAARGCRTLQQYLALRSAWPYSAAVSQFLASPQLAALLRALLGERVFLFNEQVRPGPGRSLQARSRLLAGGCGARRPGCSGAPCPPQFIVKPARSRGSAFRWHRDCEWCRAGLAQRHSYLSLWCALDDMAPDNGALWVVPGSHVQGAAQAGGAAKEGAADPLQPASPGSDAAAPPAASHRVGPQSLAEGGASPAGAVPLYVKAGTVVVMADTLLHCSGPNDSRHDRHAWMPQFSSGPLLWREGGEPVGLVARCP